MSMTFFSPSAASAPDSVSRTRQMPDPGSDGAGDQLAFPRGLIWGVPLAAMGWLALYFAIKLLMG